jgi:hypothetical protein
MESGLSFCPAQLSLPMIISFLVATDLSKEVTCANLFCFDLARRNDYAALGGKSGVDRFCLFGEGYGFAWEILLSEPADAGDII